MTRTKYVSREGTSDRSSKIVWECVSCYGDSTVTSNASAFEGEYQFLGFLPFNETKYNPTLAAFIKVAMQRP
jgi:hypothetical protein